MSQNLQNLQNKKCERLHNRVAVGKPPWRAFPKHA